MVYWTVMWEVVFFIPNPITLTFLLLFGVLLVSCTFIRWVLSSWFHFLTYSCDKRYREVLLHYKDCVRDILDILINCLNKKCSYVIECENNHIIRLIKCESEKKRIFGSNYHSVSLGMKSSQNWIKNDYDLSIWNLAMCYIAQLTILLREHLSNGPKSF